MSIKYSAPPFDKHLKNQAVQNKIVGFINYIKVILLVLLHMLYFVSMEMLQQKITTYLVFHCAKEV